MQKSANDLKTKLDIIVNDIKRDGGQQQQAAAEEAEAHILQAAQDAQAPAVTETVRGPVILTPFSAAVSKIPQVPFFSLPDVGSFTVDWIQGQLQGKDLCYLKVPYGVSAGLWLTVQTSKAEISHKFGVFMAEFLASVEYSSEVGKAQSSLKGLEEFAIALRSMVVGPGLLELTQQDLEKQVSSTKQQGHMHMCTCVCMHLV